MSRHHSEYTSDPVPDLSVMYKAFMDSIQKINVKMDNIEDSIRSSKGKSIRREDEYDPFQEDEFEAQSAPVWARTFNDHALHVDSNINSMKMKIPSFNGKADVDAYLEWERKVEMVFNC